MYNNCRISHYCPCTAEMQKTCSNWLGPTKKKNDDVGKVDEGTKVYDKSADSQISRGRKCESRWKN